MSNKRYSIVSDLPDWTVWDNKWKCDLFPTKSGNREYACKGNLTQENAERIADALNEAEDRDSWKRKAERLMELITLIPCETAESTPDGENCKEWNDSRDYKVPICLICKTKENARKIMEGK